MLMQYGNTVQYDQVAAPCTFHYFSTISNKYKIISLLIVDQGLPPIIIKHYL